MKHIFREGNTLADFLTNHIFSFAGSTHIQFFSRTEVPTQAKNLLQINKQGILNLRTEKCQNGKFNNQ